MRNPNIPTLALTVTPQHTCTLATPTPSLSCEASPYRYISRAVFVSFMFPEEGLITESARNVTFHLLLLFLFSHSTTVVCTRMASSKPLPQRTPQPRRSRRLRGQEPSPERVVGSTASSPFGGPISPNGENPSQQQYIYIEHTSDFMQFMMLLV